jgi:hypothetical protein
MAVTIYVQSTYKLVIGYHEVEGTRVTLKKPLVILKKVKGIDDMEVDAGATGDPALSTSAPVEMHVVGIIRHKLLFKSRPKALISSMSSFLNSVNVACYYSLFENEALVPNASDTAIIESLLVLH